MVSDVTRIADAFNLVLTWYPSHSAVAAVYVGLSALTIIFDLTEIILMARRKLSPKVAVTFNSILTAVWLIIFVLSIIGAVGASGYASGLLGIIFIFIVL